MSGKANDSQIVSRGTFASDNGEVVFDCRDFEKLRNVIEVGKQNAYDEGYTVGYDDCVQNMSFTQYMRGKDFSSTNFNISPTESTPHLMDTPGVYTFESDGILTGSVTWNNWQDWFDGNGKKIAGGRCLPATLPTLTVYDSEGNIKYQKTYDGGSKSGNYINRHDYSDFIIDALAISAGDRVEIYSYCDYRGYYYGNNWGTCSIVFSGTMTTFIKEEG